MSLSFSTGRHHQTNHSESTLSFKTWNMSDLEYPLNVSWNVDIAQEASPTQDVLPVALQQISSQPSRHHYLQTDPRQIIPSELYVQSAYRPARRDSSLHHQARPWVLPSSSYSRRHVTTNARRMGHVSTPLRNANGVSRAPLNGLMIHVEKRARNNGLVQQVPLPSSLPPDTSPTARRPTHDSTISRASSEAQSNAASNGPITPNISPSYGTIQEAGEPVINKPVYDMNPVPQTSFHEGTFDQSLLPQNLSFEAQQASLWRMASVVPQDSVNYNLYGFPTPYTIPYQEPIVYSTDDQEYGDHQYMGYQRSFTLPEQQLKSASAKKPARKHFTPEVTNTLKTWFKENSHRPYPSEETKQELLRQTGLTMNQLSNWFINARRRNWRRTRLARDS